MKVSFFNLLSIILKTDIVGIIDISDTIINMIRCFTFL